MAETAEPEAQEATWPWRTGRKVGRTIYACPHERDGHGCPDPEADVLIGLMDSPAIAAAAILAHNLLLSQRRYGARHG